MQGTSLEPLALTLALLVFWTGLGCSLIAAVFLAPVTGVAATLLPVFWLSLIGLPVASFARPFSAVLCCVTFVFWILRRPGWTLRELIFLIPVIGGLILIGFPTFRFGFDWVANANDDWANYNLSVIRYLTDGYLSAAVDGAMKGGQDYPGDCQRKTIADFTRVVERTRNFGEWIDCTQANPKNDDDARAGPPPQFQRPRGNVGHAFYGGVSVGTIALRTGIPPSVFRESAQFTEAEAIP